MLGTECPASTREMTGCLVPRRRASCSCVNPAARRHFEISRPKAIVFMFSCLYSTDAISGQIHIGYRRLARAEEPEVDHEGQPACMLAGTWPRNGISPFPPGVYQ